MKKSRELAMMDEALTRGYPRTAREPLFDGGCLTADRVEGFNPRVVGVALPWLDVL